MPPPKPPVLGLRPSAPLQPSLDTAAGAGIAGAQANHKASARKRGQPPILGAAAAAAAGMIKAAVSAAAGKPRSTRDLGAGVLGQPGSAALEAAGAGGGKTARLPPPPPARQLREHAHSWAGDSEYYRDSASEASSSGDGR